MSRSNLRFTSHALQRMLERRISRSDIARILHDGTLVEDNGEQRKYRGTVGHRRLLVVVTDTEDGVLVVTVIRAAIT